MKIIKQVILILICLNITNIYSQQEIEVIGLNYSNYSSSKYLDNQFRSTTQKVNAFVNYAHNLNENLKLIYHVAYQNFSIKTQEKLRPIFSGSLKTPTKDYFELPKIPNHEILTLALGVENKFKNNWKLSNFITFNYTDDFYGNKLNSNNYFKSFSFIKKKKTDNFTYGFGLYLDNVNKNLNVLPIISLALKNNKVGFNLFFPKSLKIWHKITANSYLELKTNLDLNTILYKNKESELSVITPDSITEEDQLKTQIFTVTTVLNYNYIINNKYKFKTGIGLPYRAYTYQLNTREYKTNQKPAIRFNLGFSYVIFE